jgi:hypothetical protein
VSTKYTRFQRGGVPLFSRVNRNDKPLIQREKSSCAKKMD